MRVERQLKDYYSQELLTLSQFIGDKDFDMTFFLLIGFSFAVESQKSLKNLKKTINILNGMMTKTQSLQWPNQATYLQLTNQDKTIYASVHAPPDDKCKQNSNFTKLSQQSGILTHNNKTHQF